MIVEIAEIQIKPGYELQFEAGVLEALPLFRRAQGCLDAKLFRTVERRNVYRLFVYWNTLEDHTVTFRGSEGFKRWRELVGSCFAAPPLVEHLDAVIPNFDTAAR